MFEFNRKNVIEAGVTGALLILPFIVAEFGLRYYRFKSLSLPYQFTAEESAGKTMWGLDLRGYSGPHPTRGWANLPNTRFVHIHPLEYKSYVMTNSAGFRNAEIEVPKPKGRQRVALIGDSLSFGTGVNNEDLYTHLLQKEYFGDKIEVVNLSQAGYGTIQEQLLYEEVGKKYEADVVILAFVPASDALDDMLFTRNMAKRDAAPAKTEESSGVKRAVIRMKIAIKDYLTRNFILYDAIKGLKKNPAVLSVLLKLGVVSSEPQDALSIVLSSRIPDEYLSAWEGSLEVLFKIKKAVERDGAKFFVVVLHNVPEIDQQIFEFSAKQFFKEGEACRSCMSKNLAEHFQKTGIDFVDTWEEFSKVQNGGQPLYFMNDGHFNKRGHDLIARILHKHLTENGYLTP